MAYYTKQGLFTIPYSKILCYSIAYYTKEGPLSAQRLNKLRHEKRLWAISEKRGAVPEVNLRVSKNRDPPSLRPALEGDLKGFFEGG